MQSRADSKLAQELQKHDAELRPDPEASAQRGTGLGENLGVTGRGPEGSGMARPEVHSQPEVVASAQRGAGDNTRLMPLSTLTNMSTECKKNVFDMRNWDLTEENDDAW